MVRQEIQTKNYGKKGRIVSGRCFGLSTKTTDIGTNKLQGQTSKSSWSIPSDFAWMPRSAFVFLEEGTCRPHRIGCFISFT